jgi:hypothetical protein
LFWQLESRAFADLSADATRVYLFMRKRLSFDCSNNGRLPFSHRDAGKVSCTSGWQRGSNALAELKHFGFIKLRNGGESGPNIRLASEWQLTAFECGGQPVSKGFMRWQGEVFERPHRGTIKQPPIGNAPTLRRQHADTRPKPERPRRVEAAESVGNAPALSPEGHRQHAYTSTITTQGKFRITSL